VSMKFLFLVMMTVFVGACAHKHQGHEGSKTECGCNTTNENKSEKKECDCAKDQKHEACDHHEGHSGHAAVTENPLMSDKITQQISQEEFNKIYTKNKTKLGKQCTNQAMTYCGKTTKDMMVSETEASCLWTKVFRASRDTMPELDGTACAKTIKGFAKK
jgi:hypothetical protein